MNIRLFWNADVSISADIRDVDVSPVGVAAFVELSPVVVGNGGGAVLFNARSTIYSASNFIISCTINLSQVQIYIELVDLCKSVHNSNNNITIQNVFQFNTISTS